MDTNFAELLREHPGWHRVLQAYSQAEADGVGLVQLAGQERSSLARAEAPLPASPESEAALVETSAASISASGQDPVGVEAPQRGLKWLRRLRDVSDVPAAELAAIHGRLIADGLLQFELGGRDEGVVYRLTRDARQALAQLNSDAPAIGSSASRAVADAA